MNVPTFLILMAVIGVAALAVRSMYEEKKSGKACSGCAGCCSQCHSSCHAVDKKESQ